ncbi:oligosaccharide flippase family protein [Vibrio navarrensis]|uniref:oligosaccharide flippase family protein n=1 Tax=Vibrio navarrensis TaxID=29495 RepID=UPI0018DB1853|nr:oligosaccharide flippase family protein [Vibrio navarrensis]
MKSQFGWSLVATVTGNLVQLISFFFIAKDIGPELFGLFTFALVFFGFASIYQDVGVSAYIIKERVTDKKDLNSIYLLTLTLSLLIFSALFVVAFHSDKGKVFQYVLYAMSLNFPILALGLVNKSILEMESRFDSISKIEIISSLLAGTISITLLYLGFSVYSLVFLGLTKSAFNTFGYNKYGRYRFSLSDGFNSSIYIKALRFSWGIIGFNTINYFGRNADKYFISKNLGDYWLGGYSLAYRFLTYPLQIITQVVSRVLYPRLSSIYGTKEFSKTVLNVIYLLSSLFFPIFSLGIAINKDVILLFLGSDWEFISEIVTILCLIGAVQVLGCMSGPIFMASGKTKWMFYIGTINTIIYVIAFYYGSKIDVYTLTTYYMYANYFVLLPTLMIISYLSSINFICLCLTITVPILFSFLNYTLIEIYKEELGIMGYGTISIVQTMCISLLLIYIMRLNIKSENGNEN